MNSLVAVLVRAVVTVLLAAGAGWLTTLVGSSADSDTGLGAGLVAFLAIAVISLVWSFLDAKGGRSFLGTVVIWAVAGLVIGVLGALQAQGFDGPIDRTILWDDVKGLSIMGGLLAVVPAVVGAGVGAIARR
ncbi:hypothetical protein [Kytococcus sedentarius]|uniref:hypothetical protein n=1 Tax=Kytococcus sedentarius TaxID=1276 RepID=UPI0035BBA3C4